jgi:type IV secretion system protein VirD4
MSRETEFPPRGSGIAGRHEIGASTRWGHPWELGASWDWSSGKLLLGHWQGRLLGRDDDRHAVTVAGNRAGKSSTVLIPNLLRYPGSALVLDPKGELARATAAHRIRMGQTVHILDPFGETGAPSASHNPFDELGQGRPEHVAADAAQLADALIISNNKDPHWTDSAKNLLRGIALHLLSTTANMASIREVRRRLNGTPAELDSLFSEMVGSSAYDGIVANIGASFLGKLEAGGRELQGILSTAQEQTAPLDDIVRITERSDFRLRELSTSRMTIYLVLPGMRMGTHYRWLRLVIQQALAAMERSPVPRGQPPVWFILEEFPSLGHMRSIETAAGLMAGFGVKLWSVLQDLTQLQTHYPKSWETFLGNAGVIQAFGNADVTTTEHLAKLLGSTQVIERQGSGCRDTP